MNDLSKIPVRQPDRWADIDREDEAIWQRYVSGEHDRDRAAACARNVAMLPPPLPEPVVTDEQRRQADEALWDLIAPLVKGHRAFLRGMK